MKPIPYNSAIKIVNSHELIFKQCVAQIAKDLDLEEDWYTKKASDLDELYNELFPIIQYKLEVSASGFQQLLYRIDIDETLLQKELSSGAHSDLTSMLTGLIIEREVKKVITRNVLSGKLDV